MSDVISLRKPLHLRLAGLMGRLDSIRGEVAVLEDLCHLAPSLSVSLAEVIAGLDDLDNDLIEAWLEAHDPTLDPEADLRIFDRIEECAAEWEKQKLVLAALGVPEERFGEHKSTFTIGFWRGRECK